MNYLANSNKTSKLRLKTGKIRFQAFYLRGTQVISDASLIPLIKSSPSMLYFDVVQAINVTDALINTIADNCYCLGGLHLYWGSGNFTADVSNKKVFLAYFRQLNT